MSPCCTDNATPPWVPPNAISEVHHNFHHPGFFFERRSSNSSGSVCRDHCFNICLRNLPLLLPRRMASANHRDQIWTWRISEPKSCEPKLHLSFRKNKNKQFKHVQTMKMMDDTHPKNSDGWDRNGSWNHSG